MNNNILIIGGYGIVGTEVVKLLSKTQQFNIYIAGRNTGKAQKAASEYNCNWRYIDVNQRASIDDALQNIDIVVNCFIGPGTPNVAVAEKVVETGIKYIDVAGSPAGHLSQIKQLDVKAKQSGALLITACGVNPGIAGILLKHHFGILDATFKSEVLFTMGADFNDISTLSLMGMGELMLLPPQVWHNNALVKPPKISKKENVGKPFSKKVFFSAGNISDDIIAIADKGKTSSIEFWSGIESFWISTILYFSVKWGKTKTKEKAARLLSRLQKMGNKKKFHSEINITVKSVGIQNNRTTELESSFYCTEVFATALAPVIVCSLIQDNKIEASGAYYATEIVNPQFFVDEMKKGGVNFEEK